jgi:hypothetical protein
LIRIIGDDIMGALVFIGLLVGLFLWAKESTTPNTAAENIRDGEKN